MTKTDKYQQGVYGVLSLARTVNPDIGYYQEHFINERFELTVRLSNGAVEMPIEAAQDYEALPASLTPDRVLQVANSYRTF